MKRSLVFFGFLGLAMAAGCSPKGSGNITYGGGGAGGDTQTSIGGSGTAGANTGGDLFGNGGTTDTGTGTGADCVSAADEDKDKDGYSVAQGDCNDCDPNVNPGAIEVPTEMGKDAADEDC
ncbi:MAG: hypothetical protein U0441_38815, partial [Polyangiaceae bacterium]